MLAVVKIRAEPHYRREAFERGLERAGYSVRARGTPTSRRDVLCQWNRKPVDEAEASAWEAAGGTVLVAENGYLGLDHEGRQYYALSAYAHNGAGWFPVGDEDRFAQLGVALQAWRKEGAHILVAAQRGIGSRQMASPPNWHENAARELRKVIVRPVRIRQHPGNHEPAVPLARDLENAWACCIWSSGSGVKALVAGIPVFFAAPHWICEGAATSFPGDVEQPLLSDELRLRAMQRLAHAQWSVDELLSGEPFIRFRDGIEAAPSPN